MAVGQRRWGVDIHPEAGEACKLGEEASVPFLGRTSLREDKVSYISKEDACQAAYVDHWEGAYQGDTALVG
jgi:hypothetical protein